MINLDIESFIDLLELSNLDEPVLSDILWLSKYMTTNKKYYVAKEKIENFSDGNKLDKKDETSNEQIKNIPSDDKRTEDNNTYGVPLFLNNKENKKLINISHKGYFNDYNQVSKYLMDFKVKTLSKRKKLFDEISTINYIVNTGILNPFFKAKKQKAYTLYLFIDYSLSMNVWKEMINEYSKLLNNGIFKSIKYVYINSDNKTLFYKDKKLTKQFNIKEITNFDNDKLIFILTDMLSNGWKNADTLEIIAEIYKLIPTYIVQMLPYRLWRSTSLKNASITTFNSTHSYPLENNYNSEIDHLLNFPDASSKKNLKLPIVNFDLAYLEIIGKTFRGKENNKIDGAIFNLKDIQKDEYPIEIRKLTGQKKVEYFFANTSPKAQELAKYLSAIPFNIPIMRMIQEKLLKESSNVYIAEVINSGLVNTHHNILKFEDDVSDVLYKLLGREKAFEIAYKNSDYIAENLGKNLSFKAYLSDDINLNDIEFLENDKNFATISCRILKSMGGEYAELANKFQKAIFLEPMIEESILNYDNHILKSGTIDEIWNKLSTVNHIFLCGVRGIGKTSILRYIQNNLKNKYIVSYINGESINNSDEFFRKIYETLINLEKMTHNQKLIPDYINKNDTDFENIKLISKNIAKDDNYILLLIDDFLSIPNFNFILKNIFSLRQNNNDSKIQFIFTGDIIPKFESSISDFAIIEIHPLNNENQNNISDITFNCEKCNTAYSFDCKELDWEQVSSSERDMGAEIEHEAEYYKACDTCSNEMSITFSCWEYPIGVENYSDVSSRGIINLEGSCSLEFNSRENDIDDYDDSTENENTFYSTLEEKEEVLEEFIENLIPYSEGEYVYDSEDYSDEDDVPNDSFLISYEFDTTYLMDLIDEIQDDLNEVKFAINDNASNIINNNSLLVKKQYTIEYDGNSIYGVDKDCNVYENDNERLLYIYPSRNRNTDDDLEEKNLAISEMKDWFFDNYDDPANFLPYETKEGGYQYLFGGPYELSNVLHEEFSSEYPSEYIESTINDIENEYGSMDWEKKPNENDYYKSNELSNIEEIEQKINKDFNINLLNPNSVIKVQVDGDFEGWDGETIIKLTNGEIWKQVEYCYLYHYSFMPKGTISFSSNGYKMKIDGTNTEVVVEKLNNVIQSKVKGTFNGWDGNTIVELINGQKWKQSTYAYSYSYTYNPDVTIYQSNFGFKIKVKGNNQTVDVERIF